MLSLAENCLQQTVTAILLNLLKKHTMVITVFLVLNQQVVQMNLRCNQSLLIRGSSAACTPPQLQPACDSPLLSYSLPHQLNKDLSCKKKNTSYGYNISNTTEMISVFSVFPTVQLIVIFFFSQSIILIVITAIFCSCQASI